MRFDISKIFQQICCISPEIKRLLWKNFYQYLATKDWGVDFLFMNYGFACLDSNEKKLLLKDLDQKYSFNIQLYHHVVSTVNLRGKDILEVGCGFGGGSFYMMKHFKPRSMIGVDFSEKIIDFCKRHHSIEGLLFSHGDAESLPFEENTFDAIINIESSRCYGSMERFLSEIYRVLRLDGYFLFADFRHKEEIPSLREKLNKSGLELLKEEVITPNVLKAMELDHKRKVRLIQRKVPNLLHKSLESFAGTKDSRIYESFKFGVNIYFNYILQKNNLNCNR